MGKLAWVTIHESGVLGVSCLTGQSHRTDYLPQKLLAIPTTLGRGLVNLLSFRSFLGPYVSVDFLSFLCFFLPSRKECFCSKELATQSSASSSCIMCFPHLSLEWTHSLWRGNMDAWLFSSIYGASVHYATISHLFSDLDQLWISARTAAHCKNRWVAYTKQQQNRKDHTSSRQHTHKDTRQTDTHTQTPNQTKKAHKETS